MHRVCGIEDSGPGDLTFVANPRYVPRLATTRASAVILSPDLQTPLPRLVSANPYLAYARAAGILHPQAPARARRRIPRRTWIPPPGWKRTCTSARWPCRGRGSAWARARVVHAHAVLYPDVEIGEDCVLHSGVHVREGCRLGRRVVVQNGAVIGGDGFGFARDQDGRYEKIPQVGIVVVEDDVEIGALVAIDRAAMKETRIGRGTKIDNLVQIGHSVTVGPRHRPRRPGRHRGQHPHRRRRDPGRPGRRGRPHHRRRSRDRHRPDRDPLLGGRGGGRVSGYPAIDNRAWLKASAVFHRLPELLKRLRELEAVR